MKNPLLRLGQETLIYGTSTVAARLFNFFLVPVYTYFLVAADYGAVATVFAFMALMNMVYQYGMDQAYLRFAKEDKSKDIFCTPFVAVCITAVLLSAALIMLSPFVAAALGLPPHYAYLIRICTAVLALDALNIVPFAKLRFDHRPWYYALTRTASIIVNAAGNIIALAYFNAGLKGIFIAGVLASLTSLALLSPVILKNIVWKNPFKTELFKKMFAFSWPFIPAGAASILVNVIDKPLLSHLAGLGAVGVYQASFKIGVFMMLIVSMFDQAWRPFFIQHSTDDNHKELFARVFTYFAAFASWVFLGLALLMPVIIQTPIKGLHLIHPDYWGGLKIIPLVLAGYLFYGFYINFMVAPVITKKTSVLMWVTLMGALASVLTNIILVPRIGILGAGWAIFISYVVMAGGLFIFLQRNYPIKYEYKKLILMAAMVILILSLNCCDGALIAKGAALALYPALMYILIRKIKLT